MLHTFIKQNHVFWRLISEGFDNLHQFVSFKFPQPFLLFIQCSVDHQRISIQLYSKNLLPTALISKSFIPAVFLLARAIFIPRQWHSFILAVNSNLWYSSFSAPSRRSWPSSSLDFDFVVVLEFSSGATLLRVLFRRRKFYDAVRLLRRICSFHVEKIRHRCFCQAVSDTCCSRSLEKTLQLSAVSLQKRHFYLHNLLHHNNNFYDTSFLSILFYKRCFLTLLWIVLNAHSPKK